MSILRRLSCKNKDLSTRLESCIEWDLETTTPAEFAILRDTSFQKDGLRTSSKAGLGLFPGLVA